MWLTAWAKCANEHRRSPCKSVRPDALRTAGIHLNLHQICGHVRMSVTDSPLKLMSWLHKPRRPPQDRKAIKYCDLLSISVTTTKWWMVVNIWRFKSVPLVTHSLSAPSCMSYFLQTVSLSFSSISHFNPLLYSSSLCLQPPYSQSVLIQFLTAVCTSVSKSESPRGLSSKGCQEDKEAGQLSANCQCP